VCQFDATINPQKFYSDLRESGNDFGSTFTCMTEMQLGRHQGWAKVEVPDVPACMPRQFLQPHVIHPSLLDSLNHLAVVLFKKECSNAPLMATFFGDIIIAADITSTPADELIVALEMNPEGVRSASGNTYAFQQKEDGERSLVLHVTDWQLKAVGEAQASNEETPFHRKMSYRMQWQPDVSFLTPKQLTISAPIDEKPLIATTDTSEDLKIAEKLTFEQIIALNERAAVIYIRETLAQVSAQAESATTPHLARLLEWMKASSESEVCKSMIKGLTASEEELILQKSLISGLEGLMLSRIGLNLASLLSGETDAIELMQEESLLSRFYVDDLFSQSYQYMVKYLESIVYKKPHMKILAIGAGMEDGIDALLRAIDRPEGLMVDHFDLADSSSAALERAKPLLQDWAHSMDFKVLDLDSDLKDQGFEIGGYDMVIAANTLYGVKNVATALNQVHQLMKPAGKLVMVELIRPPTLAIETIFGVLPG
jgi:2-polyprenyl-3-methyl-5-hydroxy-6-metoxy-1,4-benzoquinol methylase